MISILPSHTNCHRLGNSKSLSVRQLSRGICDVLYTCHINTLAKSRPVHYSPIVAIGYPIISTLFFSFFLLFHLAMDLWTEEPKSSGFTSVGVHTVTNGRYPSKWVT